MAVLIALLVFLVLLKHHGRLGPFVWDAPPCPGRRREPDRPDAERPDPGREAAREDPETVLARRLADGDLTPEEYLERLSLLQER